MLNSIPKQRLLIYLLCLGGVPILVALSVMFSRINTVTRLEKTITEMQQNAVILEKKQASNMAVRNHYREADHFYIDKYLETLTFLEPEIESLQKVLSNKNVAEDEKAKKRLEFLTGSSNAMVFSEGVVQTSPHFQEITETLVHPVEIDVSDLKKVLAKIEGIELSPYSPGPNRPQLLITDLKLERKTLAEQHEVYQLHLKLLKREFL